MKIKGIVFDVNAASGALGFFGKGYWYHRIFEECIPGFRQTIMDLNFVAKTTTWAEKEGHLPLNQNYEPKELFPKCIKIYPFLGAMLNAVGLSGPGFKKLLATGEFQTIERKALGISFMPVGQTIAIMLWETRNFRDKLIESINNKSFKSPIWVQVNRSCPNVDRSQEQAMAYTIDILEMLQPLRKLGLVLDLKVNYLVENELIANICKRNLCDIITISNTIKFGTEDPNINWKRLFWWRRSSPLAKFGGGGLSGKPLFESVCDKLLSLRMSGITGIPIKASGGIFSVSDVRTIKVCGADAIEFATVISLRPWRIRRMVKEARRIF